MAVFHALLERGDTVLGLSLDQGGHLTHGSPVNFSGQYYDFVPYHVDRETHLIDMDEVRALAREHRPKLILTGATAYSRFWDFAAFREIADEVGALLMTDMAHFAGLVAAGVHPSPVPHSDVVTTTTHKTLRGPRGGMILCREEHAKAIDKSVFPGHPGRAADARHRRQGGRVPRGDDRGVPRGSARDRRRTRGCSPPRSPMPAPRSSAAAPTTT